MAHNSGPKPSNSILNKRIPIFEQYNSIQLNPHYAIEFVMRIQDAIIQAFMFEKHSTAMVKKINERSD